MRGEKGWLIEERGMTSGNEERKDAHAPLVVLIGDAQVNGLERGGEGKGG